nr:pilus assembly protein PilM [Candidatus Dependentiae bacterium]
ALIDIGLTSIRLAIIVNGQLKYIRVLPTGLIVAAKKIAALVHIEPTEALEHLMRFGLEQNDKPHYTQASEEVLQDLLNELRFTIVSYTSKLKDSDTLNEVIITGAGADIPALQKLVATHMDTKSEILQAKKIMHNGQIDSKVSTLPNSFLVSLATALSLPVTQEFNLQQAQAARQEDALITHQLFAAGVLALLLITSFSVYSYLRVRNLKNTYQESSKEALSEIKRAFKLKESQATSLDTANKRANTQLQSEESTWQRLSAHNRYSLLTILAALSKCINFSELRLDMQTIKIKNNKVQLYGSVPDYTSLDILQRQLECPLFHKIGKLNNIIFKSEPIELTVKDEEGA